MPTRNVTAYVAGPMTGHEHYNFPAFDGAARLLHGVGVVPLNPAAIDRTTGFVPERPEASRAWTELDTREAMRRDLALILTSANVVAVLPGWETSAGARVEVAVAQAIGTPVYTVDELVALMTPSDGVDEEAADG